MQLQATQKYEPLWESYKKKYESSENAQRISSLKREVATIEKKSKPQTLLDMVNLSSSCVLIDEDLESEIKSMEIALIELKQHSKWYKVNIFSNSYYIYSYYIWE